MQLGGYPYYEAIDKEEFKGESVEKNLDTISYEDFQNLSIEDKIRLFLEKRNTSLLVALQLEGIGLKEIMKYFFDESGEIRKWSIMVSNFIRGGLKQEIVDLFEDVISYRDKGIRYNFGIGIEDIWWCFKAWSGWNGEVENEKYKDLEVLIEMLKCMKPKDIVKVLLSEGRELFYISTLARVYVVIRENPEIEEKLIPFATNEMFRYLSETAYPTPDDKKNTKPQT